MALTDQSLANLMQQGWALHQKKQWVQAVERYDAVLSSQPRHFEALLLKGLVALQFKDLELALELLSNATQVNPQHPDAHNNLGLVWHELHRHEEALQSFSQAISLKPNFAEAWCNKGNVLRDQHLFEPALACYDQAIQLQKDFAIAHCNRGVALRSLKRLDEALLSFDRSIALQPDLVQAHNNRGNLLKELQRFDQAMASLDQAIALAPEDAQAHLNRGNVFQELLQLDDALQCYRKAIELAPHEADGFWNTSLLLLLMGQFELGWQLYEWRWKLNGFTSQHRHFEKPLWLGQEPLQGQTLLLHAEQGLGDAIQFSRYAKLVQQRGAKVMLEVPQALVAWAGQLGGVDQAVIKGQDLPPHDLHCPLMSLPLAFRTSLSDIPGPSPHPGVDRLKSQAWRERLGHTTKPRVGLVWSGGKAHRYDHKRSMSLAQMLDPLPAGIEYVSLQQTASEPELAQLLARGVSHHGHLLHDFADTAALCDQMDLVISVDTSVAHLAATMGQTTWTLLPCSPDWRWLLNRSDSPWYPSMKLYRQDTSRDWSVPMAQVRQDLLARFQLTE